MEWREELSEGNFSERSQSMSKQMDLQLELLLKNFAALFW